MTNRLKILKMKIFIIDDDEIFTHKLKIDIENIGDYEVLTFSTAARAAGQLSLKPDLIFLDHFLKRLKGTDIIPLILDKLPNCKIVSISSQEDIRIFEQVISSGAYGYIKKDSSITDNVKKLFSAIENKSEPNMLDRLKDMILVYKKREKPLVFIVDDDETFNFLLQYKLSEFDNYEVETFFDGDSVINSADRKPDILVLDYHLKKMNGSVVLEHFKRVSPDTKNIMVTSQQEVDIAIKLMDIGAYDYVVKGEGVIDNIKIAMNKALA